jgi:hypothetical protein
MALEAFDFLQISEDQETVTYNLSDKLTIISILNLPHTLSKAELTNLFKIEGVLRFYKKSLFWVLVTEDLDMVKQVEARLKEDIIVYR